MSSGTRSLSGKNAGSPMTQSAPSTGPTDRADAADDDDRHEDAASRRPGRTARCGIVCDAPAEQRAAEPGDATGEGERTQLHAGRLTVYAAAPSGLSRTAMVVRPTPVRRRRATTNVTTTSTPSTT